MSTPAAALSVEQLELLAYLVADRLARQPLLAAPLVDVRAVAAYLGVEPSFVYEHAVELGARRLGTGPKAPLRFSLAEVDERLSVCSNGQKVSREGIPSWQPESAPPPITAFGHWYRPAAHKGRSEPA